MTDTPQIYTRTLSTGRICNITVRYMPISRQHFPTPLPEDLTKAEKREFLNWRRDVILQENTRTKRLFEMSQAQAQVLGGLSRWPQKHSSL